VRVQQFETGAVVESAIEVDSLDAEVKAVKRFKKLSGTSLVVSPATNWRTASVYRLFRTRA